MPRAGYAMGTAGPLVLGIVLAAGIAAAHAAPLVRAANDVRSPTGQFSPILAAYRHCWTHNGRRHCTSHSPRHVYGPSNDYSAYYEHIPEKLPFGSQRWWDEMVRENRGGNGGGGGRN